MIARCLGIVTLLAVGTAHAAHVPIRPEGARASSAKKTRRKRVPQIPPRKDEPGPSGAVAEPVPAESTDASSETSPAPAGEVEREKKVEFEVRAFVQSRFIAVNERPNALLKGMTPVLPSVRAFIEADVQPTLRVLRDRLRISADLSFYASTSQPQHLFLMNEAFVEARIAGPVFVLAGRKRIIWGSGLAANPTDLLNPTKNPLDFEQQRTGAFHFPALEVITKRVSFTALVSPKIKTNEWAVPVEMDFSKLIAAARLYFLAANTDFNLMYFFDLGKKRHYGGLSISRVFGEMFETHAELLVGQGPSDIPPLAFVPTCGAPPSSAFKKVTAALIAGGRVDFADQTFVALEYSFNGNGLDKAGYDVFVTQAPCLRDTFATQPLPLQNTIGHPVDPPLFFLRQHYLIASFHRPHLTADALEAFSIGAAVIWSVEDLSALVQARLGYRFGTNSSVGLIGAWWVGPAGSEQTLGSTRLAGLVDLKLSY